MPVFGTAVTFELCVGSLTNLEVSQCLDRIYSLSNTRVVRHLSRLFFLPLWELDLF